MTKQSNEDSAEYDIGVFLSHKSEDKPLVTQVARSLGLRGVRVWLDSQELPVGVDLASRLHRAIAKHHLMIVFLSPAALASSWVHEELEVALKFEQDGRGESIIPVFLADPTELILSCPQLASKWMDPEQTRAERLGIISADKADPNADTIADKIAQRVYDLAETRMRSDVRIVIDQRGSGPKRGMPSLPPALATMPAPLLLFRPDLEERARDAVIPRQVWGDTANMMHQATQRALEIGPARPQRIHYYGKCQMAMAAQLGASLDRRSRNAYVFYQDGELSRVHLDLALFLKPLSGGIPALVRDRGSRNSALDATGAIMITPPDHPRIGVAREHIISIGKGVMPWSLVPTPERISETDDILRVARDVTATVQALAEGDHLHTLYIYHMSATFLLTGVMALLTHVVDRIVIMEWIGAESNYRPYPIIK